MRLDTTFELSVHPGASDARSLSAGEEGAN